MIKICYRHAYRPLHFEECYYFTLKLNITNACYYNNYTLLCHRKISYINVNRKYPVTHGGHRHRAMLLINPKVFTAQNCTPNIIHAYIQIDILRFSKFKGTEFSTFRKP